MTPYYYVVTAIDVHENESGASVEAFADIATDRPEPTLPTRYALHANVPNPFNPRTTLAFDLPKSGPLTLVVHDVKGRHVRTLVRGFMPAGTHVVRWDGRDEQLREVASGVYVSTLSAGGFTHSHRLVLLR